MLVTLLSPEREWALTCQDIVILFYPDAKVILQFDEKCDLSLQVSIEKRGKELLAWAFVETPQGPLREEISREWQSLAGDARNQQKRLVKLALFRLLCRFTQKSPGPWGILTGIRPTKIVHRLLDTLWKPEAIIEHLQENFGMDPDKAALLTDIGVRQRPFLLNAEQAKNRVSVYIGIPFCPSRCSYCSFPAYEAGKSGHLLSCFLPALNKEIRIMGDKLKELGVSVQTVYVGGGTPTVLDNCQLNVLLEHIRESLVSGLTTEITVEAGRPDTIDREKLKTILGYGVTRLSINPQTMNEHTLRIIGRKHSAAETVQSMNLARQVGFTNINMDIILGLPGEELADVRKTLEEIRKLHPENLTVHTLAVKRASQLREAGETYMLPHGETVERMLDLTAQAAEKMGMLPYYLYRQKKMVGHLENIGYTVPGRDCVYNIQMIEERQTIIGIGGGAGSKFVQPGSWYLTSCYNPKDPANYVERVDALAAKKGEILNEIF